MKPFRVGIDSYGLGPLKLSPFEVLDWADAHGAQGVQFTLLHIPEGQPVDDAYLDGLAGAAAKRGLYLEWAGGQHIPYDTRSWEPRDLVPINRLAARQARRLGAKVVRSCSGGLMRWTDVAPPTEVLMDETVRALAELEPIYAELGLTLAIEIHFEFTTFELLRIFERCGAEPGGWLGICLDTMNLLTMLEDPVTGTQRVLPWVVATHVKDGGLLLDEQGLASFTAEIGGGVVDLERILELLAGLPHPVHLSIEDHGGCFPIPIYDADFLARFPDLTAGELASLLRLVRDNERRPPAERVRPLERDDWPQHCERRLQAGIERLRRMVAG